VPDKPQALVAGIFVGAVVALLGVTRLVDAFDALIPRGVVRGIQLAVGLKLAIKVGMLQGLSQLKCCNAPLLPMRLTALQAEMS
jgi:hypothetical protein